MTVEVKAEYLRGNSWIHGDNPEHKVCPLQMALDAMGISCDVGATHVWKRPYTYGLYKIPDSWNSISVSEYIQAANEGSDKSVFVELEEVKEPAA